jgi:hypothetical protein
MYKYAIKIGQTAWGTQDFYNKAKRIRTYHPKVKMCWICIGVPPAMEDAECLERLFHVDNRANHIKGKWFKKDVLASIASILQVTGAQAIQCESISKDKNSGTGNSIGGPFHTDPGSLYIMSCKFNSKQLKICEDIYNSGITEEGMECEEGEKGYFCLFCLYGAKVGMTKGRNGNGQ